MSDSIWIVLGFSLLATAIGICIGYIAATMEYMSELARFATSFAELEKKFTEMERKNYNG